MTSFATYVVDLTAPAGTVESDAEIDKAADALDELDIDRMFADILAQVMRDSKKFRGWKLTAHTETREI